MQQELSLINLVFKYKVQILAFVIILVLIGNFTPYFSVVKEHPFLTLFFIFLFPFFFFCFRSRINMVYEQQELNRSMEGEYPSLHEEFTPPPLEEVIPTYDERMVSN